MKEHRKVNVAKTSIFVMVINSLQVVMMLVILGLIVFGPEDTATRLQIRILAGIAALVVGSGACFDIRDALNTRRLLSQADEMAATIGNMAAHNNTLRAQRHDFLNHLQVVYSLIEMREYDEANRYIEQVYGQITAVSRSMKTANAAVNALLQVKAAACEKAGVHLTLAINSSWKDLPMEGWEMCKVLSNLIDNAIDALSERADDRQLRITLTEDIHGCRFEVADNGPMIPAEKLGRIFEAGFTTKLSGHGMGLYIARQTMRMAGGELTVDSSPEETVFSGVLPRKSA